MYTIELVLMRFRIGMPGLDVGCCNISDSFLMALILVRCVEVVGAIGCVLWVECWVHETTGACVY